MLTTFTQHSREGRRDGHFKRRATPSTDAAVQPPGRDAQPRAARGDRAGASDELYLHDARRVAPTRRLTAMLTITVRAASGALPSGYVLLNDVTIGAHDGEIIRSAPPVTVNLWQAFAPITRKD